MSFVCYCIGVIILIICLTIMSDNIILDIYVSIHGFSIRGSFPFHSLLLLHLRKCSIMKQASSKIIFKKPPLLHYNNLDNKFSHT